TQALLSLCREGRRFKRISVFSRRRRRYICLQLPACLVLAGPTATLSSAFKLLSSRLPAGTAKFEFQRTGRIVDLEICMNNLAKATRDWLSIKALVPSLHLLHMARPSISPGRSVFFEGLRFRRDAVTWSLKLKMEWVLRQLRFTLRRAYRETIYYRELFD